MGIGDVNIKRFDGIVKILHDARYIPRLTKNLTSLDSLHANGFIHKSKSDRETIKINNSAITMIKGKKTMNIYRLLDSTIVGGAHSVESSDDITKFWHLRLGHLGEHVFFFNCKRNLLKRVKCCLLDFCVLGKRSRAIGPYEGA